MALTMRPGSAPTYVRRWPRISASSRTPPRATRTNLRPRARATLSPSDGLPTPGGPTSTITAPEPRPPTTCRPRWARRLRTARYSTIRSLTSSSPCGARLPRDLQHGVQPGTDPARFRALVAGPLQPADLAQRRLADLARQIGLLHPGAEIICAVRFALAEFLADRGQLLAQQELALALLHPVPDVLTDLLGDVHLGQVGAGPTDQQLEATLDLRGLQHLTLLFSGEVRGPAGRVGQLGRLGHLLDGVDHLPGVTLLQVRDDQRLVFCGKLFGPLG